MYILLGNNKTIREKGFTDQFQKHKSNDNRDDSFTVLSYN